MKHERQVLLNASWIAVPFGALAMALLWRSDYSLTTQWTLTILLSLLTLWAIAALHNRVVFPLRTVSNMLAALRERDFSMRARAARSDDAMGEVLLEVNALAGLLREQRLAAIEASALLRRIMAQIDVAVLAFDSEQRLCLLNGYGEQLLRRPTEALLGISAQSLGMANLLEGETPRIVDTTFAGRSGRWELRRGSFLEGGVARQLIVLSDLTRPLREEERQAWQRLVQVLRHEVNNSLAPICSLAESLTKLLGDRPAEDSREDLREGLSVIADRSKSLTRFMTAYAQLARLPAPQVREFRLDECIRRVAGLETRLTVKVATGEDMLLRADPDQIEQMLVNLVRNAAEAALQTGGATGGGVTIGWGIAPGAAEQCEIWIDDEGPGISNPANLFVPFYTTKPTGSGIGLVLCRQIAEAHGGNVTLVNRTSRGCRATCRLPLDARDA